MSYNKHVINDPVFGFISIPNDFIYKLVLHPFVQRLSRIKQLGMASFVYPGAQHTRFNHSIGAMHLMQEAIKVLKNKGHKITEEEYNGVLAAILLHDIGHGPFSHVLEHTLIENVTHEQISLALMNLLNKEFDGKLNTCIAIFKNEYPKKYLHQLVSSQVDIDRLDYLRRDCFFCGVTEGNIGSERLIRLFDIKDHELVIESKGVYSIENFLLSRRLMYWQVYHHKTAVAAECVLINILKRAKDLISKKFDLFASPSLKYFLKNKINTLDTDIQSIQHFINLDDSDIYTSVKVWCESSDFILSTLSKSFIDRKLFKVDVLTEVPSELKIDALIKKYMSLFTLTREDATYLVSPRIVTTDVYDDKENSILILNNNGTISNVTEMSELLNIQLLSKFTEKYYLTYYEV